MFVTLHAILLLTLLVGMVVGVFALRRNKVSSRQAVVAAALTSFSIMAGVTAGSHLCHEGRPVTQFLIPSLCTALAILTIESSRKRRLVAAGMVLMSGGLSWHFSEVVHEPGWTGNRRWPGYAQAMARSQGKVAAEKGGLPDIDLPAGWLRDSQIWPILEPNFRDRPLSRREIGRAWHSWLTGLYPYQLAPQDFWYPGGKPREALPRIENRDRVENPTRGPSR